MGFDVDTYLDVGFIWCVRWYAEIYIWIFCFWFFLRGWGMGMGNGKVGFCGREVWICILVGGGKRIGFWVVWMRIETGLGKNWVMRWFVGGSGQVREREIGGYVKNFLHSC